MNNNILNRRAFLTQAAAFGLVSGCVSPQLCGAKTIRFASWNMGHFALGKNWKTSVKPADGPKMAAKYRAFLDEIGADVLGVCEYYDQLTTDRLCPSNSSVYARYAKCHVGPQHEWQWNAQFWNGYRVLEQRFVDYPKRSQRTYFLQTRLDVEGTDVLFVQTHMDWNIRQKGHEGDRADQIRQLIRALSAEKRVVVAGDFNTAICIRGQKPKDCPHEFEPFREAGFTVGNDGRFKTAPSGKLEVSIDNIIVRGLGLSEFAVHDRPDLSDHALVSATLTVES